MAMRSINKKLFETSDTHLLPFSIPYDTPSRYRRVYLLQEVISTIILMQVDIFIINITIGCSRLVITSLIDLQQHCSSSGTK